MSYDDDGYRTDLRPCLGWVASNDDPEHRGRIRAILPGVVDETPTGWLEPVPVAGPAGYAVWAVPKRNAPVWVEWYRGNPDEGFWRAAGAPGTDSPTEVGGDVDAVAVASADYILVLRPGSATLRSRTTDDAVTLGGGDLSVSVRAGASVTISAGGSIDLVAPRVSVNGTPLIPGLNLF